MTTQPRFRAELYRNKQGHEVWRILGPTGPPVGTDIESDHDMQWILDQMNGVERPLCEMGSQTLFDDGSSPTCEEPLPQPASYAVTVGEQQTRVLCSVCTDKAVSAAIGMGERVEAHRLDEGL